jgi:soluble lytic murein transglycosylase
VSSYTARSEVKPRQRRRSRVRRRRGALVAGAIGLAMATIAVAAGIGPLGDAVRQITLPLSHEDIIRQQAKEKGLDPSLVAAIIYEESKFRDQTSHAGARGLMQITPGTADYIAEKSGGIAFEQGDLATPQINIAYGTYYLRLLLHKYDGSEILALAAYNAGQANVDRWLAEARASGEPFRVAAHIPFAETRAYVDRVLQAQKDYRSTYGRELGLR